MDYLYSTLRERYHAHPIFLGSEKIKPGMLLECRWRPSWPGSPDKPEFIREDGLAWELMGVNPKKYQSERVSANILTEGISFRTEWGAGLQSPHLGLDVGIDAKHAWSVLVEITGIEACAFKSSATAYLLTNELKSLQQSKPDLWRWVEKDYLVLQSYHVTSLSVTFRTQQEGSARAVLADKIHPISAKASLKWSGDHRLELTGSNCVPLAVQGIRI